jgi:hypothetical protein
MMSKARLRLIRCSGDIEPQARGRRRECSFQLTVIDGGRRPIAAERVDPWKALFDVFDRALLIAEANYAAILAASLTTLELYGRTETWKTNSGAGRVTNARWDASPRSQ